MIYFTRLIWWIKATFSANLLKNGRELKLPANTVMYKEIGRFKILVNQQLAENE